MANNRIYLRCKECGGELFLGKHFGGPYYWTDYSEANGLEPRPLGKQLNDFFEKHYLECGADEWLFELEYEITEEEDDGEIH